MRKAFAFVPVCSRLLQQRKASITFPDRTHTFWMCCSLLCRGGRGADGDAGSQEARGDWALFPTPQRFWPERLPFKAFRKHPPSPLCDPHTGRTWIPPGLFRSLKCPTHFPLHGLLLFLPALLRVPGLHSKAPTLLNLNNLNLLAGLALPLGCLARVCTGGDKDKGGGMESNLLCLAAQPSGLSSWDLRRPLSGAPAAWLRDSGKFLSERNCRSPLN